MTPENRAALGVVTVIGAIGLAQLVSIVLLAWVAYAAARLGHRSLSRALYLAGALMTVITALSVGPRPGPGYSLVALGRFALAHYVMMGLFCGVAYVAGRRVTASLPYASGWEQLAFSTTLGFGLLALVVLAIGLLGWLYPPVLIATGVFMLLVCGRTIRELLTDLKSLNWSISFSRVSIGGAMMFAMAPVLMLPLYPPTQFDATNYHLVYAKNYAIHHQIIYVPFLRTPVFPQMVEMLFTAMLTLTDDIGSQLVHFAAFLLVLCLSYAWALRLFSPRAGRCAVLLGLTSPLLLWEAGSAYIDLGLTAFVTAALYALCNWVLSPRPAWLVLSAALAGFAAGTKYSALPTLLLALALVLYKSVRLRSWHPPLLFGLIAGLSLSPFYIRNLYYTGNPVWPLLSPLFGYGEWSPLDYQANLASIQEARGMGTDALALLQLPWHLAFQWSSFGNRLPVISPLHLLLMASLFVGLADCRIRLLFLLVVPSVLAWFWTAQDARYLLPLLPLLNVLLSGSLDRATSLKLLRSWHLTMPSIYTILGLAVLSFGIGYATFELYKDGYPPTDSEERDLYLSTHISPYTAIKWLNDNVVGYRVYQLYAEDGNYFFAGEVVGDWFGRGRYEDITRAAESGQKLYDKLKSLGATHFFVSDRHPLKLPSDEAFAQEFRPVYSAGGVLVYELAAKDAGTSGR